MKPVFEPDDFTPQIWETSQDGNRLQFMACGRRFLHAPFTENDRGGKACDRLTHPVFILIEAPAVILYGFTDTDHEWRVSLPHEHGISDSAARAALTEAWRGVEEITAAAWPATTHKFHFKTDFALALDPQAKPQEKTMLRNITAWLHWGGWTRKEMTMEKRARALSDMGLPTTGKALKRAAQEAGL